jgi:hypothetical protein
MASQAETRLRYAALELRQAMEALVYDRALAFKDDIPPEQLKIWQPRKLMGVLLQIDPSINFASTIAIGEQPDLGTRAPPEVMRVIGTDTPLTLKDLKDHYDALGSYLHVPELERLMSGNLPDMDKLRARCDAIVSIVDKVLSSRIWNSTFGNYATLDACMNEDCQQPIKKRLPHGQQEIDARCFSCDAEYTIKYGSGDHTVEWIPKQIPVKCPTPHCPRTMHLWPHEVRPGTNWTCHDCGAKQEIALSVIAKDSDS